MVKNQSRFRIVLPPKKPKKISDYQTLVDFFTAIHLKHRYKLYGLVFMSPDFRKHVALQLGVRQKGLLAFAKAKLKQKGLI
jgi:hypothetical protein